MTTNHATSPDSNSEAAKFLERDFNQCFAQLRHYDAQIWDICRFSFTAYTGVLGVAIGAHQYSLTHPNIELSRVSIAILVVGFLIGVFAFGLTIRNRVYFVIVARYINEHRGFFLSSKPLGFPNATRMFTDPGKPPFLSWLSSQTGLSGVIALLNATLLATLVAIVFEGAAHRLSYALLTFVSFFGAQAIAAVWYLCYRERKSPSCALWGGKC